MVARWTHCLVGGGSLHFFSRGGGSLSSQPVFSGARALSACWFLVSSLLSVMSRSSILESGMVLLALLVPPSRIGPCGAEAGLLVNFCAVNFLEVFLGLVLWSAVVCLLHSLAAGSSCALSSLERSAVVCSGHVLSPLLSLSSLLLFFQLPVR